MNTRACCVVSRPAGTFLLFVAVASALQPTESAWAEFASLSRHSRPVTPAEVLGGAPAGGFVHEFFVTSDTDVLSAGWINIDVPLYQDPLGRDVAPPPLGLATLSPALTADSFISMPGASTFIAGGGFGAADSAWGDTTNDGPQTNHLFARLTTSQTGTFSGRIALRGSGTYHALPFEFLLPGSAADFDLLASEPTYSLVYSLDPPPPTPEPIVATPVVPTPTPMPIEIALPEPEPAPQAPIEAPPVELPPAPEPEPEPISTPDPADIVEITLPADQLQVFPIGRPSLTIQPVLEGGASIVLLRDLLWDRMFHVETVIGELIPFKYPIENESWESDVAVTQSFADWQLITLSSGATINAFSLSATSLQAFREAGVPEPASAVLALGGFIALAWKRRLRLSSGK